VTIDELETCISRLLALARSRGIREIDTASRDEYWRVTGSEWMNIAEEPTLALGSLREDVAELTKVQEDPGRASAVDLERVAALLYVIADDLAGSR